MQEIDNVSFLSSSNATRTNLERLMRPLSCYLSTNKIADLAEDNQNSEDYCWNFIHQHFHSSLSITLTNLKPFGRKENSQFTI